MTGSEQVAQLHVQVGRSVVDRQFHVDFARLESSQFSLSDRTHVSDSFDRTA